MTLKLLALVALSLIVASCAMKLGAAASSANSHKVKVVSVTGAAGQIAYSTLFRICQGDLLGEDVAIDLRLLEVDNPLVQKALDGVMCELRDCKFPLLSKMSKHTDPVECFADADVALLIGARPRSKGMERRDLLLANAEIFKAQGKALNISAKKTCKTIVVGNPANTNCLIAMTHCPSISRRNFSCLMRLDFNRAVSMLAEKVGEPVDSLCDVYVWGNHSSSVYADYRFCKTGDGASVKDAIGDEDWNRGVFLPTIGARGASIIELRGLSSAGSAAHASIEHVRDWLAGTGGKVVSMGVCSDGNTYGVPEGLVFGFPVSCSEGDYRLVPGIDLDEFASQRIRSCVDELVSEREAVAHLLQ